MTERTAFLDHITALLQGIEAEGLTKRERLITGAQGAHVQMAGRQMLNLCANNYLGLADDPRLIAAARRCGYAHVGWSPAGFLGDELPSDKYPNQQLLDKALRDRERQKDADLRANFLNQPQY